MSDDDLRIDIRQCLRDAGLVTAAPTSLPITVVGAATVAGGPDLACCTPLTRGPLSVEEAEQLAGLLKAVAEPTRLRLLSLVAAHEGGEACVCDLTEPVGLSQPTVSHHLKILVAAGLLTREKRGVWAYYQVVTERLQQVVRALTPGP
jgi:ArsR family transcriptional regulator, arsenate/arsenite/antimonite-responsive transcriptional repressor